MELHNDVASLAEVEAWEQRLARDLAQRNPCLTEDELDAVVQGTIEGIVFLRLCEDRGLETFGSLWELRGGAGTFSRLLAILRQVEVRCRAGLFQFASESEGASAEAVCARHLLVDDKPLQEMIERLCPGPGPSSKSSSLPVETLGQVHEHFLDKRIRLGTGRQPVVVYRRATRKARGAYYTPPYIVNYIIEHTVGKLLEENGNVPFLPEPSAKSFGLPERPAKASASECSGLVAAGCAPALGRRGDVLSRPALSILDPACGGGAFLLGAYEYLLNCYRDRYVALGPEKHVGELCREPGGDWRLTGAARQRILLDHIYGVDLDPQAVAITKLSLLLKMLEDQPATEPDVKKDEWPELGNNIKSGNALIDPDFCNHQPPDSLTEEERRELKAFAWPAEFPELFNQDNLGFDVVLGNPPYVFGEHHDQQAKRYFRARFELAKGQYDTYWLFLEQGLRLTAVGGRLGMIVPDALLARDEAASARQLLLDQGLERVYHCGTVFRAGVSTAVMVVAKGHRPERIVGEVRSGRKAVAEHHCSRQRFESDGQRRLLVHASDAEACLLDRLQKMGTRLDEWVSISRGEETGKTRVSTEGLIPILVGEDVARYLIRRPSRFAQAVSKKADHYRAPKIVLVKTGDHCVAALDRQALVTMQSLYNIHVTVPEVFPETILGILNSRLTRFFIAKTCTAYKALFPQLNQATLRSLPICADIPRLQGPLVDLVKRMLVLQERSAGAVTEEERTSVEGAIAEADQQIDRLVYALYGLTEEEARMVERVGCPAKKTAGRHRSCRSTQSKWSITNHP